MNKESKANRNLRRTLGLSSLIAAGVGVVVAQGCFVSVLQGVGINAASFVPALFLAFILTICYVLTFSELSMMMPSAGSISTYTEVAIGHFPSIVATISGYLGPAIFAAPAELFLVEYILDMLYPNTFHYAGLWIFALILFFNILGVQIFSAVQNVLAFTMIVGLLIVGVTGVANQGVEEASASALLVRVTSLDWSILSLTVLALWAFLGLEFICPLVEETVQPEKNIPKAMIISAIILLFVYVLIALAGYQNVRSEDLATSSAPHWLLVSTLFGDAGKLIMATLSITATCSTLNTVTATVPRMLYGMAQNQQLPNIFAKVHHKWKTPWVSIFFVAGLSIFSFMIFRNSQNAITLMMVSAATAWLIAYIIAHIDLIVLRMRYPNFKRIYRSPLYPLPQVIGIIGMFYLLLNNSPSPDLTKKVYLNAGILISVTATYAWFWIKFKMKKGLFETETLE